MLPAKWLSCSGHEFVALHIYFHAGLLCFRYLKIRNHLTLLPNWHLRLTGCHWCPKRRFIIGSAEEKMFAWELIIVENVSTSARISVRLSVMLCPYCDGVMFPISITNANQDVSISCSDSCIWFSEYWSHEKNHLRYVYLYIDYHFDENSFVNVYVRTLSSYIWEFSGLDLCKNKCISTFRQGTFRRISKPPFKFSHTMICYILTDKIFIRNWIYLRSSV